MIYEHQINGKDVYFSGQMIARFRGGLRGTFRFHSLDFGEICIYLVKLKLIFLAILNHSRKNLIYFMALFQICRLSRFSTPSKSIQRIFFNFFLFRIGGQR